MGKGWKSLPRQAEELCFPISFLFSFPEASTVQLHLIFRAEKS